MLLMDQSGTTAAAASAVLLVMLLVVLAVAVFYIACMWKIFTKAGQPGWAAIIPIYNLIVLLQVCQRPLWWIILYIFFAPIIAIILLFDLARVFGRSGAFAVGLWFLGVIFFPILAFGDSRYVAQGQMVRVG